VRSADPVSDAVDLLCDGKIVGWFNGRSELGPRALGQRSILYDPRLPNGKEILNQRVKKREMFRPFAPSVLLEAVGDWFEVDGTDPESPFMLRVCRFRPDKRPVVPAVVHVDGSGRLQTLTPEANGPFYELVRRFYERTGVPLVLNTSFNVMGEPIVETPADAIACLLGSGLDCCVFEDRIAFRQVKW
jgi:carbamoyltransferase